MAKPITREAIGGCPSDCPQPRNPDWHHCPHCLKTQVSHHHVLPRSQGGKGHKEVVVPICQEVHDNVHARIWQNHIAEGIYVLATADGEPIGQWDIATWSGIGLDDSPYQISEPLPPVLPEDYERAGQELGAPGHVSLIGIVVDPGTTYERWNAYLQTVGPLAGSAGKWMLADLLNFGEQAFESKYTQAIEDHWGFAKQTLMNLCSVAGRVPHENREPSLSFDHHAKVAPLPVTEQRGWLDAALAGGWSASQLAAEIKGETEKDECEHAWTCTTCGKTR